MVLKRLKLHQFLDDAARTFSYRQSWVMEAGPQLGGAGVESSPEKIFARLGKICWT